MLTPITFSSEPLLAREILVNFMFCLFGTNTTGLILKSYAANFSQESKLRILTSMIWIQLWFKLGNSIDNKKRAHARSLWDAFQQPLRSSLFLRPHYCVSTMRQDYVSDEHLYLMSLGQFPHGLWTVARSTGLQGNSITLPPLQS